mmetsp:Transcript_17397/g.28071  ORF Transcript_17397/g.28071 Transcript_17397/m.28071 type:complete len:527 (+) Transcript_17397:398-1978(+)|eukprot:CAMPEP_0203767910 /NCGR_PEP_ID=MMETSP0099_2-20121227/1274_1 /ASSEMBLY_ACC=CAM_ASM_000209 /TAXON_ID=96639 /ORGANISM=" , Strain NY0313808BC1" /LENGTH=526 /DNA_ID=CAMNT_0050664501 /DNA_START=319 /DNA_END=1899 /DNA_ORIENTATION=-
MNSTTSNIRISSLLTRNAQQYPERTCTIDVASGRESTYSQTLQRVSKLANGLQGHGLSEEGRVAVVMFNSDRYFELFFSCAWAGGIVVPINIRLALPEMIEIFIDCRVEFVVLDDAFKSVAEGLGDKVPSLKRIIYAGDGVNPIKGSLSYENIISSNTPISSSTRGGDDTFGLFYTGGTTGKSKGVMLTHSNVFINALGHVAMLRFTHQSRYLHSAPMFHLADGASTFGITVVGGSHVFISKFVPEDMLAAIQDFRVTKAMMVPAMLGMMMQVPNKSKYDCSSLENIMYGASPMPNALLGPAMASFPNAKFTGGFGLTETSPAVCMLGEEFHVKNHPKLTSVGRPVPWVEVMICDTDGNEVPRGSVGEIVTRGPHVMKGYWEMESKTRDTLRGGWLHTEDVGYMDEDGFVFIVDRLKDMIITGGENVYSNEVEQAVAKFPNVSMCAVIGTPSSKYGEIVTAVVVPLAGKTINKDELITHCRNLIAGYKIPRKVFIRESLPMSGAGKILKNELRKQFKTDALGNSSL